MALTETKTIDQIIVTENGIILIREATRILKDDVQVAQTFHRWSFAPGDDISTMPDNVKAIAQAAWTPEVIEAYQSSLNTGTLNAT